MAMVINIFIELFHLFHEMGKALWAIPWVAVVRNGEIRVFPTLLNVLIHIRVHIPR